MEQPTPESCPARGSHGVGWLGGTCLPSHPGCVFVELGKGMSHGSGL